MKGAETTYVNNFAPLFKIVKLYINLFILIILQGSIMMTIYNKIHVSSEAGV